MNRFLPVDEFRSRLQQGEAAGDEMGTPAGQSFLGFDLGRPTAATMNRSLHRRYHQLRRAAIGEPFVICCYTEIVGDDETPIPPIGKNGQVTPAYEGIVAGIGYVLHWKWELSVSISVTKSVVEPLEIPLGVPLEIMST